MSISVWGIAMCRWTWEEGRVVETWRTAVLLCKLILWQCAPFPKQNQKAPIRAACYLSRSLTTQTTVCWNYAVVVVNEKCVCMELRYCVVSVLSKNHQKSPRCFHLLFLKQLIEIKRHIWYFALGRWHICQFSHFIDCI